MICHEVDYKIIGHDIQMVEISLDPKEAVIAEAGALNHMEVGVQFETKMGDGSPIDSGLFSKAFSLGKRWLTGESLFLTHFTNQSNSMKKVVFSAPIPGAIVPVNLAQYGQSLYCQKEAFLAAALGTRLDVAFTTNLSAGMFGGEGFALQKLTGDGMAFINAGGSVIKKELENDKLFVDTGCLVAFTDGIEYQIEMVRGLKSMLFGAEGLFITTLSGTGTVWIQSMPFSRFAHQVLRYIPTHNRG